MDNFLRQMPADEAADCTAGSDQHPPVLDGYRTGRLLGTGGSACVWLVEELCSGETLALKVFSGYTGDSDPGTRIGQPARLLQRELAVLGGLDHPHLLGVRGAAFTDQGPGLLMDLAGGGSLHNLLAARGRLSIGETVTVLAPIAQALAYLHSHSVQHGDVSPGNVLFTSEGKPLLSDLGVGRFLGEAGAPVHGTVGFTDAVRGNAAQGRASDVFSLAAIGWYSLTGYPPEPERKRVPLTVLVPDVPVELLHVLEAGLHDDPAQRPSAGELAETVLRSAAAQPLDLVPAVHPSILPELLTRRVGMSQKQRPRRGLVSFLEASQRRRRISDLPKIGWSGFGFSRSTSARRASDSPKVVLGMAQGRTRRTGRRSMQRSAQRRFPWRAVAPGAIAALLVLSGLLLLGRPVTGPGGVSGERSATWNAGPVPGAPSTTEAEHGLAEAGNMENLPTGGNRVELSSEMRSRLADPDPVRALSALVAVRALALATGDALLLSHVNVEDSPSMVADMGLAASLEERGHIFQGLSIRLRDTAPTTSLDVPEGSAAVVGTAVISGYTERDSAGGIVRTVAESVPQDLVFVLQKEQDRWKIVGVHNGSSV